MIDILPLRKERARHPETLLERRSVVAVLLRRILRRRNGFHRAPAHRATANATLSAAKDACGVRAILPRPERWGLPSRGARRFSSFRASHFHPTGWQPPETLPRLKTGFFFCDHGGGKGWIAAPGDRFASFRPSDAPPLHRFHIGYDANVIALLGAVVNQPGGSGLFCSLAEHNRLRATESP